MEGWGSPYIDGVHHEDVGWVMWGWGGLFRGEWVMEEWGGSWRGVVGDAWVGYVIYG